MESGYGILIRNLDMESGYESGYGIRIRNLNTESGYEYSDTNPDSKYGMLGTDFVLNLISGSGCGFKLCFCLKHLDTRIHETESGYGIRIQNPDLITLQIQNPDSQSIYGILIWNPNSNIESGYRIKIRIPVHNPNTKSRNVNRSRIRYFDPESGYEYRNSFQILSTDSDPYGLFCPFFIKIDFKKCALILINGQKRPYGSESGSVSVLSI